MADPELLLGSREVDMLGGEAQEAGVVVHRLLPLDGATPEGAWPVVDAPGDADAEPVGGALPFPAHDGPQVVDVLDDPDQLLGLHQVEGDVAGHALPLWDDSLGDFPGWPGRCLSAMGPSRFTRGSASGLPAGASTPPRTPPLLLPPWRS